MDQKIRVLINRKPYDLEDPIQTGTSLKKLAGIPLGDVLFLQRPGDDEVIANEAKVTLKDGDHLHSQPPADYGSAAAEMLCDSSLAPERVALHHEAGGWSSLVISDYPLPANFTPNRVKLLVKLPPGFPDAAPDMFWVRPAVRTADGCLPRSTCNERLLGKEWQRFSWHLAPGAWKPGVSTLRDFLRCVAARFLRKD